MAPGRPAQPAPRPGRSTTRPAAVVAGAALLAMLGYQSLASSYPSTTSPDAADPFGGHLRDEALGVAGGDVPDRVTVFDGETPAVANLDPALLSALREAATDAAGDGIEFNVNGGWRSRAYQEQLYRDAVSTYGSEEEAARWVATPDASAHVTGHAVDIGGPEASAWLSRNGAEYGLCQIYDNEPWHYELRPDAVMNGCPHRYADPTQDPRMQQ